MIVSVRKEILIGPILNVFWVAIEYQELWLVCTFGTRITTRDAPGVSYA